MTTIDQNRLKGNYAANLIAEWLSRVCLVRPVAEGTDIGIDLYCESVIRNTPFLHFWVQVKAINNSHISTDGKSAWFNFKTSHLHYWSRQPVPLYAFLVPIHNWPPALPERIFIVQLTKWILDNGIPEQQKTKTIETSHVIEASNIDRYLSHLIQTEIPHDTAILLIDKGIFAPLPKGQNSDPESFPFPFGLARRYLGKFIETAKNTFTLAELNLGTDTEQIQESSLQGWMQELESLTQVVNNLKTIIEYRILRQKNANNK